MWFICTCNDFAEENMRVRVKIENFIIFISKTFVGFFLVWKIQGPLVLWPWQAFYTSKNASDTINISGGATIKDFPTFTWTFWVLQGNSFLTPSVGNVCEKKFFLWDDSIIFCLCIAWYWRGAGRIIMAVEDRRLISWVNSFVVTNDFSKKVWHWVAI